MNSRRRRSPGWVGKRMLVPAGALVVGLAMVGSAFACVSSGNAMTVIPDFGSANSPLAVSTESLGNSLAPNFPGFYFRYVQPSAGLSSHSCHISGSPIGASVSSTASGNIQQGVFPFLTKYTRTITNLGSAGTGLACWATAQMVATQLTSNKVITVNPN